MRPLLISDLAHAQATQTPGPWQVAVRAMVKLYSRRGDYFADLLLGIYPTPDAMSGADWGDVATHLINIYRGGELSAKILKFTRAWLLGEWRDLRDLPCVGPYVTDCVGYHCFGDVDIESGNLELKKTISEKSLERG